MSPLDADILVQVGPADPFAGADELPVVALFWRAVREPRVPVERYCDVAAIGQLGRECVLGHGDALRPGCRESHG